MLETGINSLRQCFYGILVGMMALAPFTWALDVIIPEARTGRRENEHSFIERHKAFRWGNICPSVTKREAFEWYTTSVLN